MKFAQIHRRLVLGVLVLLCTGLFAQWSAAATIRWRNDKFSYVAQNKPVKEFLREFGANQGLTAVVSPDIDGTLNGKFDMTPQTMLDLVATTYGVIWYYDGNILFFYPSSEASTEVIRSSGPKIGVLKTTIEKLGITDPKYPIAFDFKNNTALVSGPKRYIELIRHTMQAIDSNDSNKAETDVGVYRLKYAWAADHEYQHGGRTHVLPGVATVLRRLYAEGSGNTVVPAVSNDALTSLQKLRALGYVPKDGASANLGGAMQYDPVKAGQGGYADLPAYDDGRGVTGSRGHAKLPQFEADGRLNAVIVRDAPDRIPFHRAVIESLDVRPAMVEIEARIIEVSSEDFNSLGLDWRLRTGGVDLQFSNRALPTLSYDSAAAPGSPQTPPGAVTLAPTLKGGLLTSLAGDSARYLLARVNALTQEGKANILSSPKVTTLDNVEAIIENVQTFFVRVAGNLDVGLYNVSAGTSLRVTPLVVEEGSGTQVKLAVRIEDGRVNAGMVDNIPTVGRSTLSSESFVKVGETLLIAGYASEASASDETGVPGLSKIPVLGGLFSYKGQRKLRVERLFMLTPRVVTLQ